MTIRPGKITFKRIRETDIPLLHRWFNTPHVSEWWSISGNHHPSLEEVKRKYMPRIQGKDSVDCYLINIDKKPVGMVESCKLDDFPDERAGIGLARNCAGLDIFIGEEDYLHRGLSTIIIRQFLEEIVFRGYRADYCVVDPFVENKIAIKAYKKAGFSYLRTAWSEAENRREDIYIIRRYEIMPAESETGIKSEGNEAESSMPPVSLIHDRVRIIDQTRLPARLVYLDLADYRDVVSAINELKVRGAPAIGVAGAYAVVLGALKIKTASRDAFLKELQVVIDFIAATRPTARNLFFALERMKKAAEKGKSPADIKKVLIAEAENIRQEEAGATGLLSRYGAELLKDGWTVLTHCNTGPLATCGSGTAFGVIVAAREQGKEISVLAGETRPMLQGSRLTAWELKQANVPVKIITDSMAGHFMKSGKVDCVITGADRIAANGDAANKIGTYTLAVLAKENKIPFYIAAPVSSIDQSLKTGDEIPIEERRPEEVTHLNGYSIAPQGVSALNPAFDITPHRYITAIITDKGIIKEPYTESIKSVLKK